MKTITLCSVMCAAALMCGCRPKSVDSSPDMAMYELRGAVRQCVVTTCDSATTLYSDTLAFSRSGRLIRETAFEYRYRPGTSLLSSVSLGNGLTIPISISTDEGFTFAQGETLAVSEYGDTLRYVFSQIRDSIGQLAGYRCEQQVKLYGDTAYHPGDFNTAAAQEWSGGRISTQYINGGYYATHFTYFYDSDGYLSGETAQGYNELGEWLSETSYQYVDFDSRGNWLKRISTTICDSIATTTIQQRIITYY